MCLEVIPIDALQSAISSISGTVGEEINPVDHLEFHSLEAIVVVQVCVRRAVLLNEKNKQQRWWKTDDE